MVTEIPVFSSGPVDSFEKAYPYVKEIELTIEERTPIKTLRTSKFTKKDIPYKIRCSNGLCSKGGFEICSELELNVFWKRLKESKGIVSCSGKEEKHKDCLNFISYSVHVDYFPENMVK